MADHVTVRSYRRVWRVEHRIRKIDERWVVPWPRGVPVLGAVYFLGALATVAMVAQLPIVGDLLGLVSWPWIYLALPFVIAAIGTRYEPDGRKAHRFATSWLAYQLRARHSSAGRSLVDPEQPRALRGEIAVVGDEDLPELRPSTVDGPAVVRFREPMTVSCPRRGVRVARADRNGAHAVDVGAGERLEVIA